MSLAIDANVSANTTGATSLTSPSFSTASANELLIVMVGYLTTATPPLSNCTVSGASLTWVNVLHDDSADYFGFYGVIEVWRAFASSTLSGKTVTVTFPSAAGSSPASLTVNSISGVDTTGTNGSGAIGATNSGNDNSGTTAPSLSLTTTRGNSWVWGVGVDPFASATRTIGSGQTLIHEYNDTNSASDYWMQRQTTTTAASGTNVTINDTAPTSDVWGLAIFEILPALSANHFLCSLGCGT